MLSSRTVDLLAGAMLVALLALLALASFGAYQLRPAPAPDDHETRIRKAVAWVRVHRLSTLDLRLHAEVSRVSAKVLDTNGRVWVVELSCKQGEVYPLSTACETR